MRTIATALMMAAGLAVVAAPALAQTGTDARQRPAYHTPGDLILERRAELGLTADQVRQIEAIRDRVQQENAPRVEQLRSAFEDRPARGTFRDLPVEERQEVRQQMRERMQDFRTVRQQLRDSNRAAGEEIHAVLTDAQREQLRTLRRDRMRDFVGPRGPRGPRGEGAWQSRRGDRRGPADGHRFYRGPRGRCF